MRINRTRRSHGLPHLAQLVEHLTVVGKKQRLSRHQGVPSSSLGAGTINDRLVDDIFTTRLLKNIEQSLKDLEEGNNRNAKSVLKTFLEVMV